MTVLVDTNVVLDIIGRDPVWLQPSLSRFRDALALGPIVVNEIIYSELCAGSDRREAVDETLRVLGLDLARVQPQGLFLAGQAFKRYREAGGVRTGVLPDFFVGAQAHAETWPLLTRDPKRYRTYFPSVELIVPTL